MLILTKVIKTLLTIITQVEDLMKEYGIKSNIKKTKKKL